MEHHSESMEAIWGHIPGLKVVIPSTPYETKGLLISAIREPDPVIFMEPKRLYRAIKQEVPDEPYTIPLGKAKIVETGEDITVISYGAQMKECNAAVASVKKMGIRAELIDLRTIYPYDPETLLDSVKKTGRLLVVHEGPQSFGVAAEIITAMIEKAFVYLEAPPTRLTGADTIFPLPRGEQHYIIKTGEIEKEITRLVNYRP
ncbi:alpha-ketoacid dehydrogenase subunit beta [Candidatus Riflebacteria bacterium]